MEIRQAKAEELPELQARLDEYGGGEVDRLDSARCFVCVDGEKIVGILPLQMVWQAGPLHIFPECSNRRMRRAASLGLFASMCKWLSGPENMTGIQWFFGVVRSKTVQKHAKRFGLFRQYIGAHIYIRKLGGA
jgi:hypothetical protein